VRFCKSCYWWECSPNYNNNNNFCNVNTNGNANNNNANNSNALAPDFKMYRSKTVAESEEKTSLKGETFPAAKAQNSQLQLDFYGANSDVPARTPPHNERVHSERSALSHSICSKQNPLDGTQKDIGTEGAKVDDSVVNLSVLKYVKTVAIKSAA